ncbi:hypothetical protein J4414_02510 [Candidatus Woesearchaeota archaeon]|nr:hypothetical protein [Candidatus Woesearchaeota archaeon]
MASQATKSLLAYINKAMKEGRHNDAITGLRTLKANTSSKEQKKRIDRNIAEIIQKDRQLENAFFKDINELEPSLP